MYNKMKDLFLKVFGPLDKSACVYFLIVTVFFFISFVIVLGADLLFLVRDFKRLNTRMVASALVLLFNIFIAYFINRLLYTMCSKSLI